MRVLKTIIFPVLFLSFLCQRCKDSPQLTSQTAIIKLDFAYASVLEAIFYSLNFGTGDTVFIRQGLPSQPDTSFSVLLTRQDRSTLDSLINNMNLSALDTSNDYGNTDGDEYNLSISKNDTLKVIHIRGSSVPVELTGLIDYVTGLKTNLEPRFRDKKN